MISERLAHYTIEAELGRGGMGVVYRATDTELQRKVALKVMSSLELASDDAKARFRQEASAAAQLSHPNVATIYQIGEDAGKLFIAMELIEGRTLEEVIASGLSIEQALALAAQLADGIAAAHAKGIVHRDIKPANVMVDGSGRIKILDFGLAKTEAGAGLTAPGSTVGTAAYMSPEQVRGENVGPASDMWSLGILLYEMVSGNRPFSAAYDAALSFQILNESAPELSSSVPDEVQAGIHRLLSKNPDDRPSDARDFLAAYAQSGSHATAARSAAAPSQLGWKAPVLGVAVILLVLAGIWLVWPSGPLADENQDGIAVFPFIAIGSETTDTFGDGFARLLTDRLDESGVVRTVEYNGLRGHIDQRGGGIASPEDARLVAAEFHAEGYVFGDVVKVPGSIVVSASMFSATGVEEASAEVAIDQESDLLHAVNDLGRQLLASRYGESGNPVNQAGVLSTESYPALKLYLQGMEQLRAGEYEEAYASFDEATYLDSTFAMAWYGLGRASAWGGNPRDPQAVLFDKALSYPEKVPKRFRERIVALKAMRLGRLEEAAALLEQATRTYPDDADAWAQRGDLHYHTNRWFGRPMSEAAGFLERAQELDPGNNEMAVHLLLIRADNSPIEHLLELLDLIAPAGWRETGDLRIVQNLIEDEFAVDSPWMDSLAVTSLQPIPWLVGMYLKEDVRMVEAYLDHLDETARDLAQRKSNLFSVLHLATGRMQVALDAFVDVGPSDWQRVLHRFTLLPALFKPNQEILDRIWRIAVIPEIEFVKVEEDAEARSSFWYHAASLALMRGDAQDAAKMRSYLQADTTDVGRGLEKMLDARRHLYRGEFADAERAADDAFSAFPHLIRRSVAGGMWLYQARLLKLEALFGLGRGEEVIRWTDALGDGNLSREDGSEADYVFPWWAAQSFMKGKAHMELEDYVEAEAAFSRFIDLYEKADPEYQHLVEDARSELDRIAVLATREPA